MSRRELARWAAPVAFLAALTVAVLLIRSGLEGGAASSTQTVPTATRATTAPTTTTKKRPAKTHTGSTTTSAAVYYTVQSGDTLGGIAARYGTSVQQLEALNPDVSATSLSIGQKIRVK